MSKRLIKIGFAAPLTNEQSIVALPMLRAVHMAVDQFISENWPDFNIEVVAKDDHADRHMALKVAKEFIDDKDIIGVVGHKNSEPTQVAAPLYHRARLLQITPSSTNSNITQNGWDNLRRMCSTDNDQGAKAAEFAIKSLGIKKACILHDGTSYGEPLARTFGKYFGQFGGKVVLTAEIRPGSKSIDGLLAQLNESKPELIYFGLTEIESAMVAKALKQAELSIFMLGTDGSKSSVFPILAGVAGEGAYMSYAGAEPSFYSEGRKFIKQYQARFGSCPVYGAETFDATLMILSSNQAAGCSSGEETLNAFKRIQSFQGASGLVKFSSEGDRINPNVTFWQVRNGCMNLIS